MGTCPLGQVFSQSSDADDVRLGLKLKGKREKKTFAEINYIFRNISKLKDIYNMQQKLGSGSFGSVYLAQHYVSGANRAIKKVMKGNVNPDKFMQEVEIMRHLDHPHIIRLFETFEEGAHIYLVLEFCTGGELLQQIAKMGHFTETEASVAMSQLLHAVHYMHTSNVCHRDLKPENFMLMTPDPISRNMLKIIDFGLSCYSQPGEIHNERCGSPLYISPQVIQCRYTRSCDLWSCGVILHIMLCGRAPFDGETMQHLFERIRVARLKLKGKAWQGISDGAKDLQRALLRRQEFRRPTAQEAMEHEWIKLRAPDALDVTLPSTLFQQLKNFHAQNKLKKAAMRIIAGQIDSTRIIQLRKAFASLDADGDGLLTADELREGMRRAGVDVGPELDDIVNAMDMDQNGQVSYSEFLAATLDRRSGIKEEVYRTAFDIFDLNRDGKITEAELCKLLEDRSIQESLGKQKAADLLRIIDADGDGGIDFREFMQMMRGGNGPMLGKGEETSSDESEDFTSTTCSENPNSACSVGSNN